MTTEETVKGWLEKAGYVADTENSNGNTYYWFDGVANKLTKTEYVTLGKNGLTSYSVYGRKKYTIKMQYKDINTFKLYDNNTLLINGVMV